ncbi:RHS repeat-associated core domain-containing protein [Hamadaea sp. NPDC050747]|uniref:RHS repeat domain-containing protein n=1 Tax=Hamadaea sp. NPDC050747 TaxID=3155789 RepID=UPI0033C5477B
MSLVLVAGLFSVLPAHPALAEGAAATAPDESSPATPVGVKTAPQAQSDQTQWSAPSVTWPSAASTTVTLPQTTTAAKTSSSTDASVLSTAPVTTTVGGLPVAVTAVDVADGGDVLSERALQDAADGSDMPGAVTLSSIDHATAEAAGAAAGLRVSRADGLNAAATVDLSVNYAAFGHAYGGDYGPRLRAVLAPACALATPDLPDCATRTPLVGGNDAKAQSVSARVELSVSAGTTAAQSIESGPGGLGTVDGADVSAAEQVVLLEATGSSDSGTFKKTSLSSALSWQAGTSSGAFSTSYKLNVPSVPGSLTPDITFSYSSSAVDGRTNAESAQTSWLGEGWSYEPGYIERSYRSCAQDKDTTPTYANATADLCWNQDNATLVWGGKSTPLVRDDATDKWKMADGDGSKIEKYVGLGNYGEGAETWQITTADGTKYYFGMNKLPTWNTGNPETHSAWNVPVFANHSSDRCYNKRGTGFANSWCVMTWRWNLDYVVDPAGNSMTYYYQKQTPKTGLNGSATNLVSYDRGGSLLKIEYGIRAGQEFTGVKPVGLVEFTQGDRCLSSCWTGGGPSPVVENWPDVPWDLDCPPVKTSCTGNVSPSFWTYRRLAKVTTKVWNHTLATPSYVPVDEWALDHAFPATSESATDPALWLDDIVHTGLTGTAVALPTVHFGGNRFANRAGFEAVNTGVNILRYRLTQVFNEFGGLTAVTYEGSDCGAGTSAPDPDWNPKRCFPQQYTPPGNTTDGGWTWWNKIRVTQVKEQDLVGGQPDVLHTYSYTNTGSSSTNILWHHNDDSFGSRLADRSWSDFRGWSTVTTVTGTAGSGTIKREQVFFRGLNGDRTDDGWGTRSVTVTDSRGVAWADLQSRAGALLEEKSFTLNAAGAEVVDSSTISFPVEWSTGSRTITGAQPPTQTAYVSENRATLSRQRLADSNTYRYHKIDYTWDQTYDRISESTDHGLVTVDVAHPEGVDGTEDDETCTLTEYAGTSAAWMTDRVAQRTVYGKTSIYPGTLCKGPDSPNNVLKQERFYYDQQAFRDLPGDASQVRGLQTKSEAVIGWKKLIGEGPCTDDFSCVGVYDTVAQTEYDIHGRPTKVTNSLGYVTTTEYAPASDKAITSITVTDPKGFTTVTAVDPLRGLPKTVTDANAKTTTGEYDALGRLTKVWRPGHSTSTTPDTEYTYAVRGSTGPSYTISYVLGPNGNTIRSFELLDGLGRTRQVQTPATSGLLITTTNYDARGLTTSTSVFNYDEVAMPYGAIVMPTAPPVEHRYTYDTAGRQTSDALWSAGAQKWTITTTSYFGDHTTVNSATGGIDATTYTDIFGRTTGLLQTNESTVVGPMSRYEYDKLDRLAKVVGSDDAAWMYTYDSRGRKTRTVDPDTGTSTTDYDADGNITKTVDGRGQVLTYTYDALGRKTGLYKSTDQTAANMLASWSYDTVPSGKGQLASSSRYIGGNQVGGSAYTQQITSYDDSYKPRHTDLIIPATEGALAGTYGIDYTYKTNGAPATQATVKKSGASVGGLADETLVYTYNSVGQTVGVAGGAASAPQTYVADTAYTYDGLVAQQILGTAGKQVRHTYSYDDATRRLTSSQVDVQTSATTWVNQKTIDAYVYDNGGNVQSIQTTTNGIVDQAECFDFDYLRRLTDAWTEASATCDSSNKQVAGVDPYRLSWTFDLAGNRKTETSYKADGSVDYLSTYTYGATGKPLHALASVVTTGTGAGTKTYDYDAAGNTISRPAPGGSQQSLSWTEDGKLSLVDDSSDTSMVYDADGNRIIRVEPGGYRTLYLPDGSELRANGSGAVMAIRYYGGVAARSANTDSSGNLTSGSTLTWTITDHHGTGSIVVDSSTLSCQRRRSAPFGAGRGSQPSGFGSKGFVGGTNDPTGLVHVGAREYDPTIGRFISVDPVFDSSDPQSWNGYAYANNAPVTSSDPTGEMRDSKDEGSGGCSGALSCEVDKPARPTGPSCENSGGASSRSATCGPTVHEPKQEDRDTESNRLFGSIAQAAGLGFVGLVNGMQSGGLCGGGGVVATVAMSGQLCIVGDDEVVGLTWTKSYGGGFGTSAGVNVAVTESDGTFDDAAGYGRYGNVALGDYEFGYGQSLDEHDQPNGVESYSVGYGKGTGYTPVSGGGQYTEVIGRPLTWNELTPVLMFGAWGALW